MSKLSIVKPEISKPDFTEDPKIVNALTAIENWANGLLGPEGAITNGAIEKETIEESRLSAALIKRLGEAVTVGVWTKVTFGAKVEQGGVSQAVGVRAELGLNVARLRGNTKIKSGEELKTGETLFTLPVGFRPPGNVEISVNPGTLQVINIATTGVVTLPGHALTSTTTLSLDGITFNLT